MSSSDEYVANLGFDASDMQSALDDTITRVAKLGAAFPELQKQTDGAERALIRASKASRDNANAIKDETAAIKGWTTPMSQRLKLIDQAAKGNLAYGASTLDMTKKEREFQSYLAQGAANDAAYASGQARVKLLGVESDAITKATKSHLEYGASTLEMTKREREFQSYLAQGAANDAAYNSSQARTAALAAEGKATDKASQARQGLIAEAKGEETARKAELTSLRSAIQGRYADAAAMQAQTGNLSRLRYAVFDVSNALGVGGLAAGAFVAGIVGANMAFEKEFAQVRRTVGVTGDEADDLYNRFLRLSTEIPVAFSSLSEIGTAAGQLGIADDRVAAFTETVAKFAATSNVSVDASATAFGRLDQLIDDVDGRYGQLASSILNVGINSVATESQIIAIASQIAATGDQAGLTADEIVGLSGSLASLGIAPEAARGTILRVFSQINAAVAQGGARLNDFAAISGKSASEFQQGWGSDFTGTFLSFLEGVNKNGGDAETQLRALGISATRDVNALLKLSQNTDLVAKNFELAATGIQSSAVLTDNFGIIAQTNAARLQVLVQSTQAWFATLGEGTAGPLAHFLELANNLVNISQQINSTDLGQGISGLLTIFAASTAALLLLGAVTGRAAGTFFALKTAIGETTIQAALGAGGIRAYGATLLGAAGAAKFFGAALKATGVGLALSVAAVLLAEGIVALSDSMKDGTQVATDYFGSIDGLSDAIKADNVALFAQRTQDANDALGDAAGKGGSWIEVLENAAKAQASLSGATDGSTGDIDEQTLSIGENSREWMKNALATNENFRGLFSNLQALKTLQSGAFENDFGVGFEGPQFDTEEFGRLLAEGAPGAAQKYVADYKAAFIEAAKGSPLQPGEALALLDENESYKAAYAAGVASSEAYKSGLSEAATGTAISEILTGIFGETEQSSEEMAASFRTTMEDVYGLINAEAQLAENTAKLGQDFATNGAQVASSGSAMQAVIQSIYASSSGAPEAASRLQGLFDALVRGGYASAAQLEPLRQIIASLAGGGDVKAIAFDMTSFAAGTDKVAKSASKAAPAVRTLVDYANDLSQVFDRSFDLRFGNQQALDTVRNGWQKIKDEIAETNKEIAEYQQQMMELSANKAVREYWLSVADTYGDTLRAGKLRAEIAQIDLDMAAASAELTKAQQKNSKTTKGSSQAARDNRAEILGMVGDYQDYITTLAASGLSQAELQKKVAQAKAEFIAQAVALGYSKDEAKRYAKAFDDVKTAINGVPRNITVKANTNPALQALGELQAKLNKLGNSTYSPTVKPKYDADGANEEIKRQRKLLSLNFYNQNGGAFRSDSGVADLRKTFQTLFGFAPSFNSGGWTGGGSPKKFAGVVEGQEFVLNQTGAQMFPRPMLDAANQGRSPFVGAAPSGGGAADQLSARQIAYLARIADAVESEKIVLLPDNLVGEAAARYNGDTAYRGD